MAEQTLLTPSQVAERFQIRERTVTRWLREGYLRGFKLAKEWRIGARRHNWYCRTDFLHDGCCCRTCCGNSSDAWVAGS